MARIVTETLPASLKHSNGAAGPAARVVLICGAALAAAGSFAAPWLLNPGEIPVEGAGEFEALIRFMAIVKAAMALGAVALIYWRLSFPASPRMTLAYIAAAVLMAAAPGVIWHMAAIGKGAALFHGGLVLFLILALADGTPAYRQLTEKVLKRRS